jgi:hypothetical protein
LAIAAACLAQPHPVATPESLARRINQAKGGETILLAAGDYGVISVGNRKFDAPGLTIAPAPGAMVIASQIEIGSSEGLTIKDIDVNIGQANFGVMVSHSSHIGFKAMNIHVSTGATTASSIPSGMMLRDSSFISVEDCEMHQLGTGLNFVDSDHLQIVRNNFEGLQSDAIRGASSQVDVIGNHASDFHPHPGDHPDFIQFWGSQAKGPSTGNQIKNNILERGGGDPVQGIFLEDNKDVVITGNALLGTMYNGIALARVQNGLVENNFVQGFTDMKTWIITRGTSEDVTVRNNVSPSVITYNDGGKPNPRYKEDHNKSIGAAKIGDDRAMKDWLAKQADR